MWIDQLVDLLLIKFLQTKKNKQLYNNICKSTLATKKKKTV